MDNLQRQIVALRNQQLTHSQIAAKLGISKSNVGYRLTHYRGDSKFPQITPVQEQLILGSLLGDAGMLTTRPTHHCIHFCQGEAQLHYLEFKHQLLHSNQKIRQRIASGFPGGKPRYHFEYYNKPYLRDSVYPLCAAPGKKTVCRAWLDKLTPMGLAFWYQDDGHAIMGGSRRKDGGHKQPIVRIATNGFTDPELDIIIDYFQDKWHWKFRKLPPNHGCGIRCVHISAKEFVNVVAPYLVLAYKVFPSTPAELVGSYQW